MQRANVIGVDSLGMDVRVSSGMEARTLRFSFNARVGIYFLLHWIVEYHCAYICSGYSRFFIRKSSY